MSVKTFKTTVTKMSILEMAGWQKSEARQPHPRLKKITKTGALTARIGVYLPVLLKRTTAQQDRQQNRNPSSRYENKSGIDALVEVEPFLESDVSEGCGSSWMGRSPYGETKVEGAHGCLENP